MVLHFEMGMHVFTEMKPVRLLKKMMPWRDGITTPQFSCVIVTGLGSGYLLWLKEFAVPFLPLDPRDACYYLSIHNGGSG